MTPRSIRRAAERKAKKAALKAEKLSGITRSAVSPVVEEELDFITDPPPPTPRPISPAQLSANRANAQLSTGPKSPETKAKVALNAVKTALTGQTVLLPGDDAAEYERHVQGFAGDYAPVGRRESDLVQSIADSWWRLRRIPCLESALLAKGYIEFSDSFDEYDPSVQPSLIAAEAFLKYEKQIRNLQLQESRLFRRYEKDRAELTALQQTRKQKEAQALEQAPAKPSAAADLGFEFSSHDSESNLRGILATNVSDPALISDPNAALGEAKSHSQAA